MDDEEKPFSIQVPTFTKRAMIDVSHYIPSALSSEPDACVCGELSYETEDREKRIFRFKLEVPIAKHVGSSLYEKNIMFPPHYTYDVFLEGGKYNYTERIPISHEIKAGDADSFIVRLATDRSTQFNLTVSFLSLGGKSLPSKNIVIDLFVPRTQRYQLTPSKSEGDQNTSLLTTNKKIRGTLAEGQYKDFQFAGVGRKPLLITIMGEDSADFGWTASIYAIDGRLEKKLGDFQGTEEFHFIPPKDGQYIIRLIKRHHFGHYTIGFFDG